MRCQCCDRRLSNLETGLKHPDRMEYLDMCFRCLEDMPFEPLYPSSHFEEDAIEDELEYFASDDAREEEE